MGDVIRLFRPKLPEQCGTCEHYEGVLMNKGQCGYPGAIRVRGRTIFEHEAPPKECPLAGGDE